MGGRLGKLVKDLAWYTRGSGGLQGVTSYKVCFKKKMVAEREKSFRKRSKISARYDEGLKQGREVGNRGGIPDVEEVGHHRLVMEHMTGRERESEMARATGQRRTLCQTPCWVLQTFSLYLQNSVRQVELSPFYR